jgi:hypothetical protein
MLWFLAAGRRMGGGGTLVTTGLETVNGLFLFALKGLLHSGIARTASNFNSNLMQVVCQYMSAYDVPQTDTLLPSANMSAINYLYAHNLGGGKITIKAGVGGAVLQVLSARQDAFIPCSQLAPPAVVGDAGTQLEYCLYPP